MTESNTPSRERIHELSSGFMSACVIGAAAELDLFTAIGANAISATSLAAKLGADRRAVAILLDALASLELLDKHDERYSVPAPLRPLLTAGTPETFLPMLHHRARMLRAWYQLAWVVKAGIPGPTQATVAGWQADRAAFIAAMHSVSASMADQLVARFGPPEFTHLLDVGGASGTWTLAFLRAAAGTRATLFDLPDAIAQARDRIRGTEFAARVELAEGDFYADDLPAGADLVWVSAIVHQHSREHNRQLLAKVHAALKPGGRIAIRDIVMEPSRTRPAAGALFAVNMLVNTESGGTFTFDEMVEDLQAAGFAEVELAVKSDDMNSVVTAIKP